MEEFDAPRGNEELPLHVLAGIKEGQEDIKAGNTFTFEEFKAQLSITTKNEANDTDFAE